MSEPQDLQTAAQGDGAAFGRLTQPLLRPLQSYILRTVAHVADAEDILQDTLLKAHRGLSAFRGESSFKTWIFSIAARTCIDHLRARKRWRVETQMDCKAAMLERPDFIERTTSVVGLPEVAFSVREHVAYCFSCVSRVLPPDQQAVVFLKEVFGFTSLEGSKLLGISESVFRHHLSEGRRVMEQAFEQLCSLIGKRGACYQCKELRESMPPGKQGEDLAGIGRPEDDLEHKLEARLQIVREADLTQGPSAKLHALFFQFLANVEEGRPLSLKN